MNKYNGLHRLWYLQIAPVSIRKTVVARRECLYDENRRLIAFTLVICLITVGNSVTNAKSNSKQKQDMAFMYT